MKTSSKLIIVLGIITTFAVGLAAGAPLGTMLLVGALLACPAMMLFGMGMHHQHSGATGDGCPNCEKKAHNHQNKASV